MFLLVEPSWLAPYNCRFCSSSKLGFKPGATQIPFLCLFSFDTLLSTSDVKKYMSASPSHPRTRENRSPASLVTYFRESCSFTQRTAVRSANVVVRVVEQVNMEPMYGL